MNTFEWESDIDDDEGGIFMTVIMIRHHRYRQ